MQKSRVQKSLREDVQSKQGSRLSMRMWEKVFWEKKPLGLLSEKGMQKSSKEKGAQYALQ
jgi:hypothetical protein